MKKALFILSLFISALSLAQVPKPLPDTYVNDLAHVLTDDQITSLNQSIAQIEQKAIVQFAVVIIDQLPKNTTIEKYTQLIGRSWHVGTNKNGLVYVAAIQDHKQRLKGASGLDGIFTKQVSLDILNTIKPSFRNSDYYAGLQTLVTEVAKTLKVKIDPVQQQDRQQAQAGQPALADQAQQGTAYVNRDNDDSGFGLFSFLAIGFIILVVILIIRAIFRGNARRRPPYPPAGPGYDAMGPPASGGGFFWGTLMGALGLYTADRIFNNDDNVNDQQGYTDDTTGNNYQDDNSNDDNSSSSWGDWGGGSDSSSDSGFSDSGSDSGSSSDW